MFSCRTSSLIWELEVCNDWSTFGYLTLKPRRFRLTQHCKHRQRHRASFSGARWVSFNVYFCPGTLVSLLRFVDDITSCVKQFVHVQPPASFTTIEIILPRFGKVSSRGHLLLLYKIIVHEKCFLSVQEFGRILVPPVLLDVFDFVDVSDGCNDRLQLRTSSLRALCRPNSAAELDERAPH